jgi:hypothetical protein
LRDEGNADRYRHLRSGQHNRGQTTGRG